MTIGTVVQRGPIIYVYDQQRDQLCIIAAGREPDCGLEGYTSSTVSVRRGNIVYLYDEPGQQLGAVAAG